MNKKKILLIGATGLLGDYFYKSLKKNKNIKLLICADNNLKNDLNKKRFFLDITNENDVKKFFELIKKKYGKIDHLINSAGLTSDLSIKQNLMIKDDFFNTRNWNKTLDVNLNGVFYCIKYFLKLHIDNAKIQKIITIGSIYGSNSPDHEIYKDEKFYTQIGYSASKSALIGMNKWISRKFSSKKIISNIISPAGVFNKKKINRNFMRKYLKKIPLGKPAAPDDIIGLVNFLISDQSNYITGENIHIDGGFST